MSSSLGRERCAWCGHNKGRAGQIGAHISVCGDCFNAWHRTQQDAKLVRDMQSEMVRIDQEIESDSRVIELRKRVQALEDLVASKTWWRNISARFDIDREGSS